MGRFFSTNQPQGVSPLAAALQGLSSGAMSGYQMGRQRRLDREAREREMEQRPLIDALRKAQAREAGIIPANEAVRTDFGGLGAIGNIATAVESAERYKPLGETGYVYDEFDNPIERHRQEVSAREDAARQRAALAASTRQAIAEMNDARERWETGISVGAQNERNAASIASRENEGKLNRALREQEGRLNRETYGVRGRGGMSAGDHRLLSAVERQIDDTRGDLYDARRNIPKPFVPLEILPDTTVSRMEREHSVQDSTARARVDSIGAALDQQNAQRAQLLGGLSPLGQAIAGQYTPPPGRGTDGAANASARLQTQGTRPAIQHPTLSPDTTAQMESLFAEAAQMRAELLEQGVDPAAVEREYQAAIANIARMVGGAQ